MHEEIARCMGGWPGIQTQDLLVVIQILAYTLLLSLIESVIGWHLTWQLEGNGFLYQEENWWCCSEDRLTLQI